MDETTQKIVDQVEKLLRVAAKTSNEAEAAAFTSKANELLAAHNLTISEVEAASSGAISGKRLDDHVAGGMYKYQKRLWVSIAELNFCMYWSMLMRTKEGSIKFKYGRQFTHTHRLVGRQVNVIATKNMGSYLEGVIKRLCIERLGEEDRSGFFSSWAVAFREGIADRIVDKVQERRNTAVDQEERKVKAAARKASKEGLSTSMALTLTGLAEREEQANYDFLNGEGAWARKKAREDQIDKEWEVRRAKEALARAEAERVYTEWAEANPEEAAEDERKALARLRAKDRQRERRGGGWGRYARATPEEMRRGSGGYHAGWDAGEKISIDQQVDIGSRKRLTHG